MTFIKTMLILLIGASIIRANDFCAVQISVNTFLGNPYDGTEVELIDSKGHVEQRARIQNGIVRFCDFKYGPHELLFFKDACMPVRVSNVRFNNLESQRLSITVPKCPHMMGTSGQYCQVTVRAMTVVGPLANASFTVDGLSNPIIADRFGRGFFAVPANSTAKLTIASKGFAPQRRQIRCPDIPEGIDEDIVFEIR